MARSGPSRNPANDHIVMFEWRQPQCAWLVHICRCFVFPFAWKTFHSSAEVYNKMQQLNFLLSCVISLWTKDSPCMHSLLRHPNCDCERKLRLLITAAAQGLIVTDSVAILNVQNCIELLWEGLFDFTKGILKGSYKLRQLLSPNEKWKLKWKEMIFSVVIITSTPTHYHPWV